MKLLTILGIAFLLFPLSGIASNSFGLHAQERSIKGLVVDSSHGPISQARVSLLTAEWQVPRSTRTDTAGRWSAVDIPGVATFVTVEAEGYQSWLSDSLSASSHRIQATLFPIPARGGKVVGRIYDTEDGTPIEGAVVRLDGEGQVTDPRGAFSFSDVQRAQAMLLVHHHQYMPRQVVLDLHRDSVTQVALSLAKAAYELDGIDVEVGQTNRYREMMGFLRRRRLGFGEYFDRQDLEQLPVNRLGDVLRHVGGIRMAPSQSPLNRQYLVEFRGRSCRPFVWVDGVQRLGGWSEVELTTMPPDDIEAMEVYRGSEVPAEFYDPANAGAGCVTIVVWSR